MRNNTSQIELSIDLDNEEDEEALKRLLSTLPLEVVVLQTLSQAGFERPVVVALLITNDATIQSMNKHYRSQDKPTDVLSFPMLDKPIVQAPVEQLWIPTELRDGEEIRSRHAFVSPPDITMHLGDIVISWPTVQRQASEAGHNPTYELLFLLSHGVLHLVGYDDQTEAGYQSMIRLQQAAMEASGLKV